MWDELFDFGSSYFKKRAADKVADAAKSDATAAAGSALPGMPMPEAPPVRVGSGGGRMINQSVSPAGAAQRAWDEHAMQRNLAAGERDEMERHQELVKALRDDGGAMPQMRRIGKYGLAAPQPLEYAGTIAARLASQYQQGQLAQQQRGYTDRRLEDLMRLYHAQFGGGGAPVTPGDN